MRGRITRLRPSAAVGLLGGLVVVHSNGCSSEQSQGGVGATAGAGGSGATAGAGGSGATAGAGGSGATAGAGGLGTAGGAGGMGAVGGAGGLGTAGGAGGMGAVGGAGGAAGAGATGGSGAGGSAGVSCLTATPVPTANPSYTDPFAPSVMTQGGTGYVLHTGQTQWRRWTGVTWAQEAVPWPTGFATLNPYLWSEAFSTPTHLPTGEVIVTIVTPPSDTWFTTFDGSSLNEPMPRPSGTQLINITHTSDGRYHALVEPVAPSLLSGDPVNGWGAPVSLGIPAVSSASMAAVAVMPDDRLIVAYAAGSPRHLYVLSKPAGGSWGSATDLTPTWAADAQNVKVASAVDGVVIGVEAGGTTHPHLWSTSDGTSFTHHYLDTLVGAGLLFLSATCLDAPNLVLGSHAGHYAYSHAGGSWTTLGSLIINYLDPSSLGVLPDGTTIWALHYVGSNTVDLRVAP